MNRIVTWLGFEKVKSEPFLVSSPQGTEIDGKAYKSYQLDHIGDNFSIYLVYTLYYTQHKIQ